MDLLVSAFKKYKYNHFFNFWEWNSWRGLRTNLMHGFYGIHLDHHVT
jgi:uncharacterized protein with HEPN domain